MTKFKIKNSNSKTKVLAFGICALCLFWVLSFGICHYSFAQEDDLELSLKINSATIPLPKVLRPNIDLSGRGFNLREDWPKSLAVPEVLDLWQQDIGFGGAYRIQHDLWEMQEAAKSKELQDKLLSNYETIFKKITDSGGVVILDIFGMPAGLGKVLDKISAPRDFKAYKELIKAMIRYLSCEKKYNIWYEVWTTPDREDFFLGRRQDYLNLYRAVAEAAKELQAETKIHVPVGGPSVSWWFQSDEGNSIITPERSLIYTLIKFCFHYRLPLDFISWHGYSSDPRIERETTVYKKAAVSLVRDWLSYFHFDRATPLIIDEWNYDSGANVLAERYERSNISASYIPSRLKNMYESGLDYQFYFALEDFRNAQGAMLRNVGIFSFNAEDSKYKDSPKAIYNVFRMLSSLGNNLFTSTEKLSDEFVGVIATKSQGYLAMIIYNYVDPQAARNYILRNIATLSSAGRRALLRLIKANKLDQIIIRQTDITSLRVDKKLKSLLEKAQKLNDRAAKYALSPRNIKISIKGLNAKYIYQRYKIDSSCAFNCEFSPIEEKEAGATELYQEILALNPYSVNLIVLKEKPPEPPPAPAPAPEAAPGALQNITNVTN